MAYVDILIKKKKTLLHMLQDSLTVWRDRYKNDQFQKQSSVVNYS